METQARIAQSEVFPRRLGAPAEALPLCVDLDGTLVLTDLLHESLVLLVKRQPYYLFVAPLWLLRGRSVLKAETAARVQMNPATLPYNQPLIRWLESERNSGRSLWLCTAANERLANAVATYLGLFDSTLASNRDTNLSGATKAARMVALFGERGFDYCANERRDISVWKHARGAIVVHRSDQLLDEVSRHTSVLRDFPRYPNFMRAVMRSLRPHQWAKNALVVMPLLGSHRADEIGSLAAALLATLAFCMCASAIYVVNDLLDLEADRSHPRKSLRPFASGDLPLPMGFILAPLLLGAAWLAAAFLPTQFQVVLVIYGVLAVAYSFALKGLVLIDVVTLAGLYTIRVIAGTAAVAAPLSFWLLWFSMFFFLSLAFVKRFAELDSLRRQRRLSAAGRGYSVEDMPTLQNLGIAGGYLSVLILALYIHSPEIEQLYSRPQLIWILCVVVLYWISRIWMKTQRSEMHDDPLVFALKDPMSLAVFVVAAITIVIAI